MIERVNRERDFSKSSEIVGEGITGYTPVEPSLQHTPGTVHIQGIPTRVFLLKDNTGRMWRLYYANGLPRSSGRVRQKLASLLPGGLGAGSARFQSPQADGDDDALASAAQQIAGRVLLRVESQVGPQWKKVIDTVEVRKLKIANMLEIPPGWQRQTQLKAQAQIDPRDLCPEHVPGQTEANVLGGPGPSIGHAEAHHFFWGRTFADPAHREAVTSYMQAFNEVYNFRYHFGLINYGFRDGRNVGFHIWNDNPPFYAGGSAGAAAAGTFVLDRGLDGTGPFVWYQFGGPDPLYMLYIAEGSVEQSGWGGFHFYVPNHLDMVIPFPFNLLVKPFMPYAVVKVPDAALAFPLHGIAFRNNCAIIPNLCDLLGPFDRWTVGATHEFVEAVSEPFPPWGWFDPLRSPFWENGEIADICQMDGHPWGETAGINGVAVATYWANFCDACVPESRPSVIIISPSNGQIIPWRLGGASVSLRGTAADTLGVDLSTGIIWSVDGIDLATRGAMVTAAGFAVGPHTISARVTDARHLTFSANVRIQIVAQPPQATIFSPADGASFAADAIIPFRGSGIDPKDGTLPDAALVWQVNGMNIGSGHFLTRNIPAQGPATVTMTAMNSDGLSATATSHITITAPLGNPSVAISQPTDGGHFPILLGQTTTAPIIFSASASSAGGGPIANSSIQWFSDVDGFLGTGATLQHTLSGGFCSLTTHHITVVVIDANGRIAIDTITVQTGQIC